MASEVTLSVFEATIGSQTSVNVLSILPHTKFHISLFKAQVESLLQFVKMARAIARMNDKAFCMSMNGTSRTLNLIVAFVKHSCTMSISWLIGNFLQFQL